MGGREGGTSNIAVETLAYYSQTSAKFWKVSSKENFGASPDGNL